MTGHSALARQRNRIQAIENQRRRLENRLAALYRRSSQVAQLRLAVFADDVGDADEQAGLREHVLLGRLRAVACDARLRDDLG